MKKALATLLVTLPLATLSAQDPAPPAPPSGKYAAQWTGSFEKGNFAGELPFQMRVPKDLEKGVKVPLLIFLHGSGERGNDNQRQLKHDPTRLAPADVFTKNPMIVVAPQCPAGQFWGGAPLESVIHLVKDLQKELPVDPERIYLTGLSMGGYGTWGALAMEPGLFAAAVPICGGGDPKAARKFAKVPIWAFHSEGDPVVNVENTRAMIAALKQAGGEPKYTEYRDDLHDSWTQTYKNPDLWEWLLGQKRRP
jgi:predicted peptidase